MLLRRLRRLWLPYRPFCSSDIDPNQPEDPAAYPLPPADQVRVLPIPRHPIFPKHPVRFRLNTESFNSLIDDPTNSVVGAFVRKQVAKAELDQGQVLHTIHSLSDVAKVFNVGSLCETSFNRFHRTVTLTPISRIRLTDVIPSAVRERFPMAHFSRFPSQHTSVQTPQDKQLMKTLFTTVEDLRALLSQQELHTAEVIADRFDMKLDEDLLDYVGVMMSYMVDADKVQKVFETETISERIQATLALLQEHARLRVSMRELQSEANSKMSKNHEEHVYRDILGLVKNKLGMDKDEKETLKAKYKQNLEGKTVPLHVQKIIDEELDRFQTIDKHSSEFHVIRTYLDWLTCLPYGVSTQETLDLEKAKAILDRDHFGMKDVKDRIIEFIAVSKLRGSAGGKILCFTGPPGVGKTSVAKSIAEALNRKYYRISLGGLDDVAELKGHRRTYVGAQPGKIISALKQCASENPVLLIDEIDKVGRRNFQGSPENALLEVLDPQQNSAFNDHYLDTTVDLSKVLFLCTANLTDDISPVLMDRMETIEVKGYTAEEKMEIFDKHLWTRTLKEMALEPHIGLFSITQEAKEVLIRDYCREAGVRKLQKLLQRILEKVAVKVLQQVHSTVDPATLKDYAGQPPFSSKRLYEVLPVGVVMGLAYTSMGGSTLYVEVVKSGFGKDAKGELKTTGNLKSVMQESIQIAYTYAKSLAFAKKNDYFDSASLHLHFPEGATPKDGPSAGVTITTALLSIAFNSPVMVDLAMTGEISLTGKVLAIGGLKEKVVAARRDSVKTVIIPAANKHSWEELPETLKTGLTVHLADSYEDVLKVALPSIHSS